MKTLLRSCFIADPANDNKDLFLLNYHALCDSRLSFETAEDTKIWEWINTFVQAHGHVPGIGALRSHFDATSTDVVERLERLILIKPLVRGDFVSYLEDKANQRRIKNTLDLAKEMAAITVSGMEIVTERGKKVTLKGPTDALRHVLDKGHGIMAPTMGARLSGNLMASGTEFLENYDRIKADPRYGLGQLSGIAQIDEALKGARKHELWIHAAFTGHLKTFFATHWAYIQAIYFGYSSLYFSLEVPMKQIRNMFYTMHSAHEDFRDVRTKLGIEGLGLVYSKIRDGQLSLPEEKFLRDYVVPDFCKNSTVPHNGPHSIDPRSYGDILVEVADPDKMDFTILDMRQRAELLYTQSPFHTVYVDHAGLVSPRSRYSNTTERLNEVIRDLKKFAGSFNRGQGIAVVGLFQISREGFKSALKSDGRYNLTHLSYANECLVKGTLIPTDQGILSIEEVKPGMQVWSRSGWKEVLNFFDQGIRPVWRITNDRGEVLEATANHRIRVVRDETIQWCRMDELHEGDWLVGTTGDYPWPEKVPELPKLDFQSGEKPCGDHGIPLRVPTYLTDECAYLLGAWDGDGRVHSKGVGFTGNRNEKAVREAICSNFKTTFGHDLGLQESPSRPGSFDLFKWSQPLKRWLDTISGVRGSKVPNVIFRSPRHLVLSYLRGLWDTDGWITNQGVVGLKMKDGNFLRDIQILMTALGIDTVLEPNQTTLQKTGKTYDAWTLRVRGTNSKYLFNHDIGFSEPSKALRLNVTTRVVDKRKYPLGKLFSEVSSTYKGHINFNKSQLNAIRKASRSGVVSHGMIVQLLQNLDISDSRLDILREALCRRITKITKIEKDVRTEPVFDIEVTGDHEFQSGAFLSHNCERSADIVTTSWAHDDVKELGRAIFQCLKARDHQPFDRCPVRVEFNHRRLLTDRTLMDDIQSQIESKRSPDADEKPRKGGGGRKKISAENDLYELETFE